ncbi:replication-relaxation family protein [Jeotgalibacillus proteolyticus]|uniref:replication-relaxation family protein n=1 Tax=Jeotgalibacillus proteolyticus TaxID=2082395 RepID=UPI001FD63E52|nr:replication-relaxation family protein [Jeotgalibacillus proteolyticus]
MKKLHFLSRSQLQQLHRLGSVRNANRILKEMSDYLHSFRVNENVYYLSKEGRDRVDCDRVTRKTLQVEHYLMRNALYILFNCPHNWRNEVRLSIPSKVSVVADALYETTSNYYLIEIDHLQKMKSNRDKVAKYRQLIELNVFKKTPVLVWVTTTEYRKKELIRLCEGLQVRIYLAKDLL